MNKQKYEDDMLTLIFLWQHTAPDVDVTSVLEDIGGFDYLLSLLKERKTVKDLIEHHQYLESIGISPRLYDE